MLLENDFSVNPLRREKIQEVTFKRNAQLLPAAEQQVDNNVLDSFDKLKALGIIITIRIYLVRAGR